MRSLTVKAKDHEQAVKNIQKIIPMFTLEYYAEEKTEDRQKQEYITIIETIDQIDHHYIVEVKQTNSYGDENTVYIDDEIQGNIEYYLHVKSGKKVLKGKL